MEKEKPQKSFNFLVGKHRITLFGLNYFEFLGHLFIKYCVIHF